MIVKTRTIWPTGMRRLRLLLCCIMSEYMRPCFPRYSFYSPPSSRLGDSEDDRISALADNLKTPITAHGLALKQDLVQTLVPTAKLLKSTHASLEAKLDIPFETGLLAFNDASRLMENF